MYNLTLTFEFKKNLNLKKKLFRYLKIVGVVLTRDIIEFKMSTWKSAVSEYKNIYFLKYLTKRFLPKLTCEGVFS